MRKYFITFLLFYTSSITVSQINWDNYTVPFLSKNNVQQDYSIDYPKSPGHYTCEQWRHRVDSVWGPGLPTATKLSIFDIFWQKIDSSYACFNNINVNWDSLKQVYRTQIEAGVSKGRFIAIMNHMTLHLMDSHTKIDDAGLSSTNLQDKPMFVLGGWHYNNRFGAGLTPLPDSSLLVYQVVPLHPLGLERGDVILGYDRIPWNVLVKEILSCELPILYDYNWIGSSPSSYTHSLLISAGKNWHLFDTIDVLKYSTNDTVHLSTFPLRNQTMNIFCTEQMNIPGVPKPVFDQQLCSFGIVPGTNIGYIYVWGWWGNVSGLFYNAVQSLMNTNGLIIDFRYNEGGNMFLSDPGLSLLFDTTKLTIDWGYRCSPNHLEMCIENNPDPYNIPGEPPGYNKPIAVLTGPGAVSSGDQVALRMKYHPQTRFFGKSTSTAFNYADTWFNLSNNYNMLLAQYDAYELNNPGVFLTHKEFEVDENIWLSKELVRQGRDDVVEAAICWIDSCVIGISHNGSTIPRSFTLFQNYPNPFNPVTKIKFDVPKMDFIAGTSNEQIVTLRIYDILGREVITLVNDKLDPGSYEVDWNGSNFSSGLYFYKMDANGFSETKKLVLIK